MGENTTSSVYHVQHLLHCYYLVLYTSCSIKVIYLVFTKLDLITFNRSESFPLRVTGWPVELMAYAFLVVSPPDMIQRFEEMAVAASNKSSSKPAVNYPELDEQALQFILDCCESNITKYTKYLEGAKGSPQVSINSKQANRTLLLKQLARDLCISERRILYRAQYILRRRLRDMRAGGELKALSLFSGLRKFFK